MTRPPKRPRIDIDPDIRKARTLPAAVYRDPAWYEEARRRVFARAWHWVGDGREIDRPGRVRPLVLLEGCLDEPVVLACDADRRIHCLSNVCTHRANLVVEEAGDVTALRCRYHGRRFDLDGRFRHMPEFEEAEGFPTPDDDLPRLSLERLGPFLFASLDPAAPFETWIEPVRERVGFLPLETFALDPASARDYLVEANWALYCDNYLEGFHIPFVHPGLAPRLEWSEYRTEVFPLGSVQIGIAPEGEPAFELPPSHPDRGERVAAYYFWLFPGTLLNFYPWGLSVNLVEPRGHDRTIVRFLSYVFREDLRGRGAGVEIDRVEIEDEAVVAAVQRGVRASKYERGRYSPTQEKGVHHFHRILAAHLDDRAGWMGAGGRPAP